MQTTSRLTLTALALGIAGVMAAGSADASGFQIRENSVKNLGRANAGLKTEYDPSWMGRYNAVVSDVKVVDLTVSAGIAFSERFSVGAGVIFQSADVTLSNAVDFGTALCAPCGWNG